MGVMQAIRKLTGETVETIEADLVKLNAQGAALVEEIEQLVTREDEVDEESVLAGVMVAAKAAKNRKRKLDSKISETRDRLAAAKAAVREKLRVRLIREAHEAGTPFLTLARSTHEAFAKYVAAREAVRSAGFVHDHRSLPVAPGINAAPFIAPDMLDVFERGFNYLPKLAAPPLLLARPTADPAPVPALKLSPPVETKADPSLTTARKHRRPLLREEQAEGERLFLIHQGLISHDRKGMLIEGDVVSLSDEEAKELLRNGVGDFITADQLAELDASGAFAGRLPSTSKPTLKTQETKS